MPKQTALTAIAVFILFFSLTSCHISQKMDAYVASQFNNKVPKPDKRTDSAVIVKSSIPSDPNELSHTVKTSKNLFLLLYWKYDYRHTCTLNSAIGVNYLRKGIYQQSSKLKQKLNGQQLEITIEQMPGTFAIVDKGHIVLLLIQWDKFYVEPDFKNIIVSYKLSQNGVATRSGKINIDILQKNKAMGFFQSWKGATREFLGRYNEYLTEMSRTIVNKLIAEL
jgi:hypothetical protein